MRGIGTAIRPRLWLALLLALAILPAHALADATVSFPVPYYRPGHYVPVALSATMANVPNETRMGLWADGAASVSLEMNDGRCTGVAPWLIFEQPRNIRLHAHREVRPVPNAELRLLGEHERLVITTIADETVSAAMFPTATVVRVLRDSSNPLPGHPAAWECADLVVLDASAAAVALSAERIGFFLSGGTSLAVDSDVAPDARWPWKRHDRGFWFLRHDPAGPRDLSVNIEVYQPVMRWAGGWSADFRRLIVLLGVAFAIVMLGMGLLGRRWAPPAMVIISAAGVGGLAFYAKSHWSAVQQCSGAITVAGAGGLVQTDSWTYQTSPVRAGANAIWQSWMRPVFAGPRQAAAMELDLACESNGDPEMFYYVVPANQKIAFLSRQVGLAAPSAAPSTQRLSPLHDLARTLYVRPGMMIAGEIPSAPVLRGNYLEATQWPTVLVGRTR